MYALGRKAILQIGNGNAQLEYPELDMEFDISFDSSADANAGSLKIYNLSQATIDLLKQNTNVNLSAGYNNDIGEVFPGVISTVTTETDGLDQSTTITLGDQSLAWNTIRVNKRWGSGTTASGIVKEIAKDLGFPIGEILIPAAGDITFKNDKIFSTTCKSALEELAKDLNLKVHISQGRLFFRPEAKGDDGTAYSIIVLNANTGLMGTPTWMSQNTRPEDRYLVKSLFNYRIKTDSILDINSRSISGRWRVDKGKYLLNGDDYTVEMEVVRYGT